MESLVLGANAAEAEKLKVRDDLLARDRVGGHVVRPDNCETVDL